MDLEKQLRDAYRYEKTYTHPEPRIAKCYTRKQLHAIPHFLRQKPVLYRQLLRKCKRAAPKPADQKDPNHVKSARFGELLFILDRYFPKILKKNHTFGGLSHHFYIYLEETA